MKPRIFQYDDFRTFLKDCMDYYSSTLPRFSQRSFSRKAGFSSPSYLKTVLDGSRKLTKTNIPRFTQALELNQKESEFFENLVNFNQAKSLEEKNAHYQQILQSQDYKRNKTIEADQYDYFSNWFIAAIRELVTLPDFQEDAHWIARRMGGRITSKQAQDALDTLLRLKLLVRNSEGKLLQRHTTLSTPQELQAIAAIRLHSQLLENAIFALKNVHQDDRDVSALIVGVLPEQLPEVKKEIATFRKKVLERLGDANQVATEIYQVSIQLVPCTKKPKKS